MVDSGDHFYLSVNAWSECSENSLGRVVIFYMFYV